MSSSATSAYLATFECHPSARLERKDHMARLEGEGGGADRYDTKLEI